MSKNYLQTLRDSLVKGRNQDNWEGDVDEILSVWAAILMTLSELQSCCLFQLEKKQMKKTVLVIAARDHTQNLKWNMEKQIHVGKKVTTTSCSWHSWH